MGKITGGVETHQDRCQYKENMPVILAAIYLDISLTKLENSLESRNYLDSVLTLTILRH